MPLYYHPLYSGGLDSKARFPVSRYDLIHASMVSSGAPVEIRTPPKAPKRSLLLAHDSGYVSRFLAGELLDSEVRRIGLTPWTPRIVDRTTTLVGGSLAALGDVLASAGVAANMAGGTHHASMGHGAGYCIFNDIAVCAMSALQERGLSRVAVVDLDVHQGDGTAAIFAEEPRVFTASVHCDANFPFRKQRSDLDIGLQKGGGDEPYLAATAEALRAAVASGPELVIFQAGVDALEDDALGHLSVTRRGMAERNRLVFEATRGLPLLVLMGGGYAKPIERTVEAFRDLFTSAAHEHVRRQRIRAQQCERGG